MRGILPRSFDISIADPLFQTEYKDNAYLYDAALAIICSVGAKKYDLAAEIVSGALTSKQGNNSIPFVADFATATPSGTYLTHNTSALMAYALGYYLESRPTAANYCTIAKAVRDILNYLQTNREHAYNSGLINNGTTGNLLLTQDGNIIVTQDGVPLSIEGLNNTEIKTETNILAFFAFKQAGKIFNEIGYTNTSTELKETILNKLWGANKLYYGLSAIGEVDQTNVLHVSAYGALFMLEIGDTEKALILLNKCEVFACVDIENGAGGYKAFLTTSNRVWFEMSYCVALGYFKAGNTVKHNQIVNELNRFIDPNDGGVVGSLIKNYVNENLLKYKAVGSTAWSIIANLLKGSVFSIKTGITATVPCAVPFKNEALGTSFIKEGCPINTYPTSLVYTVPEGRYISWVSQESANAFATFETEAFGQAYANIQGSCISTFSVGNTYQSDFFYSQMCGVGTSPVAYEFSVQANTYFAATVEEANQVAQDYISANGQAAANTNGTCGVDSFTNYIYMTVQNQQNNGHWETLVYANSSQPVNSNVNVDYAISINGMQQVGKTVTVFNGDYTSNIESYQSNNPFVDGGWQSAEPQVEVQISNLSPDSFGNMVYQYQ